jgi:phosphoribosylformylglycinamidine synthase subunit PurL
LKVVHGRVAGRPPRLSLPAEKKLQAAVLEAHRGGLLRSAHDVSDGGLAVALAECGMTADGPKLGGRFELPAGGLSPDVLLFSESPSRMIVTSDDPAQVQETARRHGVPSARLGTVGGDRLVITIEGKTAVDQPLAALHAAFMSLERLHG